MSEMKVCYCSNYSCNTGRRAHWTSPAHPCFSSTRSTLGSRFLKILHLHCQLICESLSVSAAYTGPKCLRRKIIWHGCDHKPQTFLEPIQIFSGCFSQDDIYIEVLMGILSNFLGSMRSLAHGSGRISIYCHFVFCFKYPEHMSFNCVTFIMFSSCIYMYLLLR